MIRFEGVAKSYGGQRVIEGLDLAVAPGEICVLVGASGSGKSTILRLANALERADAGHITVDGRDVSAGDPAELRRGIGYVIQSIGLMPHWSVAENVATVPRLLGWPAERIAARVREMLALVGLDGKAMGARRPHELSGGQQQRVGVARALAADPPLLLMDEPFGALDPPTRRQLQDEVLAIHRATGKTILFVTHDMEEALRLADRLVLLQGGRILQQGRPEAIVAAPASPAVRAFFGGETATFALLARRTVGDVLQPDAPPPGAAVIGREADLATALAVMAANGQPVLAVSDAGGAPCGSVSLSALRPSPQAGGRAP